MDHVFYKIKANQTTLLNNEFNRIKQRLAEGTEHTQTFIMNTSAGLDFNRCGELVKMFNDSSTSKVKVSADCRQYIDYPATLKIVMKEIVMVEKNN